MAGILSSLEISITYFRTGFESRVWEADLGQSRVSVRRSTLALGVGLVPGFGTAGDGRGAPVRADCMLLGAGYIFLATDTGGGADATNEGAVSVGAVDAIGAVSDATGRGSAAVDAPPRQRVRAATFRTIAAVREST